MKNWLSKMAVQFITHETVRYSHLEGAQMALEGGCRWIQLRMKKYPITEVENTALKMRELCNAYNAVFIIDDHVELVARTKADGVHLGRNDMPIREARKILGDRFIIGGTANTFYDVQRHYISDANYIGCGPFRFTTTKKNLSPVLGLEGYQRIVSQMKEAGINLPLVAIGGITRDDLPSLMQTGITGIALSGSILRAESPIQEMKTIIQTIDLWKN